MLGIRLRVRWRSRWDPESWISVASCTPMRSGRKIRISPAIALTRSVTFVSRKWSHTLRDHGAGTRAAGSSRAAKEDRIVGAHIPCSGSSRPLGRGGTRRSARRCGCLNGRQRSNAASISASAVDFHDCIASSVIRAESSPRRVAERVNRQTFPFPRRTGIPLPALSVSSWKKK